MKAVIMAGGEGSRLRPITCSVPKPLVPLCGKPVLGYILELLKKHGCDGAALTLYYLGRQVEERFPEQSYLNIPLRFCYEDKPLGTAGSVKNAVSAVSEPLLIISGDAMCDFDLTAAMAFHQQCRAAVTLIVQKVEDPREYGLVNCQEDGRITGFLEKPPYSHCNTDLANTGVYILSPEVLELIPKGENMDFAADLFPLLLQKGMPLYAYEDGGYWCDIGDIRSYLRCQRDMLEGKVECTLPASGENGIYSNTDLSGLHCRLEAPVFIGAGVTIGENSIITGGTVIGDHVTVGANVKLRGSVIHEGCYIGNGAVCNEAILCKNAKMHRSSAAYECTVLGEEAVLGEESTLSAGARLWTKKEAAAGTIVSGDIKYGTARSIVIDDDGISGETNVTITPELMIKIGASVGSLKSGATVGISCNRTKAGSALKQALAAGIVSSGANALDFGETSGAEYDFCLHKSGADFGVYIDSNIITNVMMTEKCGMPMMRGLERKLEGLLNRSEYKKADWNSFGVNMDLSGLRQLYQPTILSESGCDLQGMSVQTKSADSQVQETLNGILKRLGCGTRGDHLTLILSPDGRRLSAYTKESGYVFPEKVLCLVCLSEFLNCNDVAVPYETPLALEQLAEHYGRRVMRYYACPCDGADKEAREAVSRKILLRDGIVVAIKLLSFLKERGMTLSEACRLLPEFETASRLIGIHTSPAALMKHFGTAQELGEGISVESEDGRVLLRPLKSGRGIMLFAESVRSETAAELCDFYEKKIRDTECEEDKKKF